MAAGRVPGVRPASAVVPSCILCKRGSSTLSYARVIAGRMQLRVSLVVLVNVAAASSLPLIGPCSEPRNIYIDLGVNWCNTARLFKDIEPESWPFYVYGFEASPLIQPFADEYFAWLNGDRLDEPESCLPRSGSTPHLEEFAAVYGCLTKPSNMTKMRECMWAKLAKQLGALRPSPQLNSSALISDRLGSARLHCGRANKDRFTFIPAAAGSAADASWLEFYGPPHQLIRGGSIPRSSFRSFRSQSMSADDLRYNFRVQTVDVPAWIESSFSLRDHVILKMDVEGSEHGILEQMINTSAMLLIDVLSIECHRISGKDCARLMQNVRRAAPRLQVMTESTAHGGYDSSSKLSESKQAMVLQQCSHVDLNHFSLSHRPDM